MNIIFLLIPLLLIINYKKDSKIFFYLFVIALIIIAGLRNPLSEENDTHNYFEAYELAKSSLDNIQFEIGYIFINAICIKLHLGFQSVLIIMSSISIIFVTWAAKRCGKDGFAVLMFYFLLTYYFYNFNAMRQMTGISIVILGYTYLRDKKKLIFILCILAATLFHKSCIVALLCLLFTNDKKEIPSTIANICIIFSLIIGSLNITIQFLPIFQEIFPDYIGNYSDYKAASNSFSISKLALSILFMYLYTQMDRKNLYIKTVFLGIVLFNLMSFSTAALRIAYTFTPVQALLYATSTFKTNEKLNKSIIIIYSLFVYYYMVYYNYSGVLDYEFCDFKYFNFNN